MKIKEGFQLVRLSKVQLVLCLLLATFFSCNKEEDAKVYFYLRSNPEIVDLPSSAITETYTIYSNGAWRIVPSSEEDWISIDPIEGNGDGTITVVTQDNNSPLERTLNVEFSVVGMQHSRTLEIRQEGEEQVFNIEGNPTGLEVSTEGTTETYSIHSNGMWRIELEGEGDWVSMNPDEGFGDGTFSITVSENTDADSRIANLVFYVYGQRQPIVFVINQRGTEAFRDIDGNVYETVVIGGREWMKENLRVTHYRNGDPIPTGLDNAAWSSTTAGAYAISPHAEVDGISSEEEMVATYGLLYNWHAVSNPNGLCPEGWRVPTDADWQELEITVGMSPADASSPSWRGAPAGILLKGVGGGWADSSDPGTDVFGFSGYPVAARLSNGSYDTRVGQFAFFWTGTQGAAEGSSMRRVLGHSYATINRGSVQRNEGYCIRCVRIP